MAWYSVSMIVPAAQQVSINRLFRAIGEDGSPDPGATFSIPLHEVGEEPVIAYGCHYGPFCPLAKKVFFEGLAAGNLPTGITWGDYNLTEQEAQDAIDSIFIWAVAGYPNNGFTAACANHTPPLEI